MAVNLHGERPAVFVPKPFADGGNVYAAFDARRCKEVSEVVMGEQGKAEFLARCGETFFALLIFTMKPPGAGFVSGRSRDSKPAKAAVMGIVRAS